ncbi:siroheme decarboxylase subunit beta [Thalassotalea atypica]|uniref:siroheme decarboxylase subunit beta n=1 Tax=Thalassotalea atypica TaxID=2054316 RepID=UPI0025722273|nr:hypothetical protein [Thalassotalea atypica]
MTSLRPIDAKAHVLGQVPYCSLTEQQQVKLRAIIEQGLPQVAQPYLAIAKQIDATEQQVLEQVAMWQESGLIKRFGIVVKHRQLGYTANAMVVWNIADADVEKVASKLSLYDEVSLCYRRPRRLPDWPYNLFCMIHGTDRDLVLGQIDKITNELALEDVQKDVLFSYKAYKQNGARYGKNGQKS